MRRDQVALQMYTLREQAAQDLAGTLARVAEIGYTAVEFAGLYGHAASSVRDMLDSNGLRAFAAHVPLTDFSDRFDGVVEDMRTLGCSWAIVPWLPQELRGPDQLDELARLFGTWGRQVADAGMRFAYHNHDFEFTEKLPNGEPLFHELIERTEPGVVSFELDAYWVVRGGYDPVDVLTDHADRIALLHLKDANKADPTDDAPFGDGSLDWAAILAASRAAGVELYVVEQDNPGSAFADIEASLRNAERMAE
jgi:sugar phosphate isomerase/epimerase